VQLAHANWQKYPPCSILLTSTSNNVGSHTPSGKLRFTDEMAEFRTVRLIGTLLGATLVLSGCQKKGDAISSAEQTEKINGIAAPGISETKAIAKEGFIYGLPLVMSYAIMNAYSINRSSRSFTAPINQILDEARVYTYKDRAIPLPNSDTPYSVLFMDLRAEPIVLSLPRLRRSVTTP
jgi:Protein of unknown function (DUF1254)